MKLRVVELLLVTTLPALFLASQGVPRLSTTVATLIGGTLAAGASNAFNMVIEVDSDRLMKRTSKRPLASGAVSIKAAIIFATLLSIVALAIFWVWTTPLATYLTLAAILFYVVGYTIGLKRRTSQNIVWGGIAGCMPVLIGWAAITNSLSATAWYFFLLIFFWTPPHFWALAIKYRDDYEGVKEKLKNDAVAQVQNLQNNANNILAGMGLPKKRRSKNSSKSNKKSPKENIRGSGRVPAGGEKISNSKIMHKLRGAGLVPL